MTDTRVMVLELTDAEQLVTHVAEDDTLREQLLQAIWYAEEGDICNDVYLFDNVSQFITAAVTGHVDYLVR